MQSTSRHLEAGRPGKSKTEFHTGSCLKIYTYMQSKMQEFHSQLASIDAPMCSTCCEGFPGLHLCSQSTMCQRCNRDKHTPKLCSSAKEEPTRAQPRYHLGHHTFKRFIVFLKSVEGNKDLKKRLFPSI